MKELIIFVLVLLVFALINKYSEYDDTDNEENKDRSGLILYTDNKTGLQYIKGGLFGGITPRLDIEGKHIKIKDSR